MKELFKFDQEIGDSGLKVGGALGVNASDLSINIALKYPLEKVLEPVLKVVDAAFDKIEDLIPGDQKAIALGLKEGARKEIVKLLSE